MFGILDFLNVHCSHLPRHTRESSVQIMVIQNAQGKWLYGQVFRGGWTEIHCFRNSNIYAKQLGPVPTDESQDFKPLPTFECSRSPCPGGGYRIVPGLLVDSGLDRTGKYLFPSLPEYERHLSGPIPYLNVEKYDFLSADGQCHNHYLEKIRVNIETPLTLFCKKYEILERFGRFEPCIAAMKRRGVARGVEAEKHEEEVFVLFTKTLRVCLGLANLFLDFKEQRRQIKLSPGLSPAVKLAMSATWCPQDANGTISALDHIDLCCLPSGTKVGGGEYGRASADFPAMLRCGDRFAMRVMSQRSKEMMNN